MSNLFFTSDFHSGHFKIIEVCKRPFIDVREMNETILENFNKVVKDNDIVWHIGDFGFDERAAEFLLHNLRGHWFFVKGNHDRDLSKWIVNSRNRRMDPDLWSCYNKNVSYEIPSMKDLKVGTCKLSLCHYPMISWNCSHYNTNNDLSIMLYGHHHSNIIEEKFPEITKIINVGVDLWNFSPVPFEEIVKKANSQKERWDAINR